MKETIVFGLWCVWCNGSYVLFYCVCVCEEKGIRWKVHKDKVLLCCFSSERSSILENDEEDDSAEAVFKQSSHFKPNRSSIQWSPLMTEVVSELTDRIKSMEQKDASFDWYLFHSNSQNLQVYGAGIWLHIQDSHDNLGEDLIESEIFKSWPSASDLCAVNFSLSLFFSLIPIIIISL